LVKILSIGEVMLELSDMGSGLYRKSYAGDTFNVAHYLNVVSQGRIQPEYLTAIGTDAQSDACLDFLKDKGVLTTRCLRDPARTLGLFILSNDEHGEKQYAYWRGQSAARAVFNQIQDLSGYDLIYFSGITAAIIENKDNLITSIQSARQQGAKIVYDFNYRKLLWSIQDARDFAERILAETDIVKISGEELDTLYPGQKISEFSSSFPRVEWVLTCGGEKAEVWCNGNMVAQQIFTQVEKIMDSSAAGDAFIATYIAAKLEGIDLVDALARAHTVASQVVCAKGSIVAIDMTELD